MVNCAGPWSQTLAESLVAGRRFEGMFRPSLACNLLLDRKPVSSCAVAVQPRRPNSRVYFLVPWRGRIFAGTYHAPWAGELNRPGPDQGQLKAFLADLNLAVPGLELRRSDVLRVYAGLLPAREAGGDELAVREVVWDHAKAGGPRGLVSVSGVKFTTARLVAQKALTALLGVLPPYAVGTQRPGREMATAALDLTDPAGVLTAEAGVLRTVVADMQAHEAALHLDDLLLRRTDWGADPGRIDALARRVAAAMGWSTQRLADELARLRPEN